MIRHTQLIPNHDPENGIIGDCFRTCMACILDKQVEDVPHFVEELHFIDNDNISIVDLVDNVNAWLLIAEPSIQYIDVIGEISKDIGYHIITGPSPRFKGVYHCIVGLNGRPWYDPHSSNLGVLTDDIELQYGLFIKRML